VDPALLPPREVVALADYELLTSSVSQLLKQFDIKPHKGLGQNFLISDGILDRIIDAAELEERDVVVEVGAGLGTLTRRLADRAGRVIALELDERLIPLLRQVLAPYGHVKIIQGDVLAFRPEDLVSPPYKVVANLPYYITSAILRHFLEASVKPSRLVVTVQKEVAERIVSGPGEMSLLAVSVQLYGRPRVVAKAPAGAFYPSPGVNSAVVCIDIHSSPQLTMEQEAGFFDVVRAGFAQRRKQLRNSLSQGLKLPVEEVVRVLHGAGLDEKQRPQELSVEQWVRLYRKLTATRGRAGEDES
jgi:16S rRNA (adenine1518-N6/adenine1519-N6)-dimethyltransferase